MAELLENTLQLKQPCNVRKVSVWENGMLLVQHGARQLIVVVSIFLWKCEWYFVWIRWARSSCNWTYHHTWFYNGLMDETRLQWRARKLLKRWEQSYSSKVYAARQEKILGDTLQLWQQSKRYTWSYFEGLEKSFQRRHYRKWTFVCVWCSVRG